MVGPKFKRAAGSVADLRKLEALILKSQKIPAGTEVSVVQVEDLLAEWVLAPAARKDRVILFLHGGACVMGSPATHRELAAYLSASAGATVFVPDYRLASEHPFPAAMHDAVSAFLWLLDQGHTEGHIAVGGDSAGGGLTLQSLVTLRDGGMPLPAAAFFFSPVTDWVRFDGESYATRAKVDPFNTLELCRFTASLYVGNSNPENPLFYPAAMDLSGLPPLSIHVGDREVLLSDAERFAECARAAGAEVEFKIWQGMWHAFQTNARFVPESRCSIDEVGRFVLKRLNR